MQKCKKCKECKKCIIYKIAEVQKIQEDSPQRRNSDVQASEIFSDDSEDQQDPRKDSKDFREMTNNKLIEDTSADQDDSGSVEEDEEAESLMANLQSALQISAASSDDEEDWNSTDESLSDTNTSDISDSERIFSRIEAIREELERELGMDDFMKAYKVVQAMHEDENEEIKDCEDRVRKILGNKNDQLYDKILKLVMADGAYCEDND